MLILLQIMGNAVELFELRKMDLIFMLDTPNVYVIYLEVVNALTAVIFI